MKPYILILVVIAVLVGGMYIFSSRPTQTTGIPNSSGNQAAVNPENNSRYVSYSKEAFDRVSDKKRVLFFHAPWCPTCRPADAAFQKDAALIPQSVVLFKTDYDTSTELKKKYAVTYQHTFVQVDATGKEVTKWNGGQLSELIANIK